MANYPHAVYFEAKDLTDREMGKIKTYFQISRKSHGGECGQVEKVRDNTYRIAFLEQEAVFQSLTSDLDDITCPVGGVQLHLVFGDITNETTDAIVNTTDFTDLQTGVCKDILTVAGPQVQTDLRSARVNRGDIYVSQPGGFPCTAIMHVCGDRDADVIQGLMRDVVLLCERKGYGSVAIPAICAGKGGLEPSIVAHSILSGVSTALSGPPLQHLSTIRLILFKINDFLAFKAAAQLLFGTPAQTTAPTPLSVGRATVPRPQPQSLAPDLSSLLPSGSAQAKAEFLIVGFTGDDVTSACGGLRRAYEAQCSKRTLAPEELERLNQSEREELAGRVTALGLQVQRDGAGGYMVCGLKDGLTEVAQLMQRSLLRQVRERDQEDVFARVVWCMLGPRGDWERLPKEANHKLEGSNVGGEVADGQGKRWTVNLKKMEATAAVTNQVVKMKRLENLPDFNLPLYWDCLVPGEHLKVFNLHPSSSEYRRVKTDFKRTVQQIVVKIERVQNVHLRQAYEVRKKQLKDNGAGEKLLYHGTTVQACQSIQKTGFNRSFAGQNATTYGAGTYFAVNASYSANPTYSRPEADGSQLMFVARVLTGQYTLGQSNMKSPPAISPQQPDHCYDSLVDNKQNPGMFVVFHDSQAYPDYLITFK